MYRASLNVLVLKLFNFSLIKPRITTFVEALQKSQDFMQAMEI